MPGIENTNERAERAQEALKRMDEMMPPDPEAMSDGGKDDGEEGFEMRTENQPLNATEAEDRLTNKLLSVGKVSDKIELTMEMADSKGAKAAAAAAEELWAAEGGLPHNTEQQINGEDGHVYLVLADKSGKKPVYYVSKSTEPYYEE